MLDEKWILEHWQDSEGRGSTVLARAEDINDGWADEREWMYDLVWMRQITEIEGAFRGTVLLRYPYFVKPGVDRRSLVEMVPYPTPHEDEKEAFRRYSHEYWRGYLKGRYDNA